MKKIKSFVGMFALGISCLLVTSQGLALLSKIDVGPFKSLLIQDSGRVKPLGTFFAESVLSITGKIKFQNMDATELCLDWISDPGRHEKESVILLTNDALKQEIKLDPGKRYFSPFELAQNQAFQKLLRQVNVRQKKKEKLAALENEALRLYGQLDRFYDLVRGSALKIVPFTAKDKTGHSWISPVDLLPGRIEAKGLDEKLRFDFLTVFGSVVQAFKMNETASFSHAVPVLIAIQKKIANASDIALEKYPIRQEIFYNALTPFDWSWKFYTASFLILLFASFTNRRWLAALGILVFSAGFTIHTIGFVLRSWIAGRPPVSNMYESIIWVSWGAVFFAVILGLIYRQKLYLTSASIVSAISLIASASSPTILNPHIANLEPVLRSNFWLTVHVMTITLGYAAFALALGIGHYNLFLFGWKNEDKDRLRSVSLFLYRTLQIGVILLAAGTILGGVWANDSWGRFWGWDPKEVWALIALLGYLSILHGRFAGWLREFGLALGSIIAFLGVLMAWYGVNFVLGAGLHSYGFGGGGLPYILAGIVLDLLFVLYVVIRYLRTERAKGRLLIKKKKTTRNIYGF